MIRITYLYMFLFITAVWIAVRAVCILKSKKFSMKNEARLLFVYVCIVVVARFTFFPFSKVNGMIQPLIFEIENAFSFRINVVPFINLFDYPNMKDLLLNIIGNTAMFIPLGMVWPWAFKKLNSPLKAIVSGIGFSLTIEILQLPFYDRVTDIDDLILNSIGFVLGYLIFYSFKKCKNTV